MNMKHIFKNLLRNSVFGRFMDSIETKTQFDKPGVYLCYG